MKVLNFIILDSSWYLCANNIAGLECLHLHAHA